MEINNRLNIENEKNNFFNNTFGKTINYAIDIGLRAILPDLIENQVIDIKNSLLNNGLKTGIDTAINSAVNFGKSTAGIFTGNFENIEQVKIAIGNGGIVDSISDVLDNVINSAYKKGYINRDIKNVIKNGKNVLLNFLSELFFHIVFLSFYMLSPFHQNLCYYSTFSIHSLRFPSFLHIQLVHLILFLYYLIHYF